MFNPLTDDQIDLLEDTNSLVDGYADLRVIQHFVKPSKAGDPMLTVIFDAEGKQGGRGQIRDWFILNSNNKFLVRKFKRFMIAIGHEKQYNSGEIMENSLNGSWVTGLLKKNKDNEYFGITEYIQQEKPANPPSQVKFDPENDDVPF